MKTESRENRINYVEFPTASKESHAATKKFYEEAFGRSYQSWGDDYSDTQSGGIASGINCSEHRKVIKGSVPH